MNRFLAVSALFAFLSGCSPYQLRGLVIEGNAPGIEIVKQNDPRLEQPGLASANIEVLLDPSRFNPKMIGNGQSDREGHFAVPISEPGAGFLMLDVEVQVKRERYQSEVKRFDLPGSGQRLLVTMQAGRDAKPAENPNVLEETLRDAEPFLRNNVD